MKIKPEFFFRSQDKIGGLIIIMFIIGVSAYRFYNFEVKEHPVTRDSIFITQAEILLNTLAEKQYLASFDREKEKKPILKPFDPNKADLEIFTSLGLKKYIAQNIIKYRDKGGVFFRKEDFSKIYGLDDDMFKTLLPYIVIDTLFLNEMREKRFAAIHKDSSKINKLVNNYPQKYKEITPIEINSADTSLLMKIPGIGIVTAKTLINYRNRLGGYVSAQQIDEIDFINDTLKVILKEWFYTDLTKVRKININKTSVSALKNHPYINFYQAKAIIEYKNRGIKPRGIEELAFLDEFSSDDIVRLKPYLSFE